MADKAFWLSRRDLALWQPAVILWRDDEHRRAEIAWGDPVRRRVTTTGRLKPRRTESLIDKKEAEWQR